MKMRFFKIDDCKEKQISGYMKICWQLIFTSVYLEFVLAS